jgi:hypothetical protein
MKYAYYIYENPEIISTKIETDAPLPHMAVGAQLILTTDDYAQRSGTVLVIEHIRATISYLKGSFFRNDIHVFCRVEEKPLPQ